MQRLKNVGIFHRRIAHSDFLKNHLYSKHLLGVNVSVINRNLPGTAQLQLFSKQHKWLLTGGSLKRAKRAIKLLSAACATQLKCSKANQLWFWIQ